MGLRHLISINSQICGTFVWGCSGADSAPPVGASSVGGALRQRRVRVLLGLSADFLAVEVQTRRVPGEPRFVPRLLSLLQRQCSGAKERRGT